MTVDILAMLKSLTSPLALFFIIYLLVFLTSVFRCIKYCVRKDGAREYVKVCSGFSVFSLSRLVCVLVLYTASLPITANLVVLDIRSDFEQSSGRFEYGKFVVVLGGSSYFDGFTNRAQLGVSGDRLLLATEIYKQQRTDSIILSGGISHGSDNRQSESLRDAEILSTLGVPENAIKLETSSTSTLENVDFVLSRFPELQTATWGLLTSATHMRRANWLFCQRGVYPILLPADMPSMRYPQEAIQWLIPTVGNLGLVSKYIQERLALYYYSLKVSHSNPIC